MLIRCSRLKSVMARTLITAIQNGEESLAKDIIQNGTYGVNDNQTVSIVDKALFICCSRGLLELAELLLEKGANVATTDKNQATPLHGAVDNGHVQLVRLLINSGANLNAQTNRGDTPLHLATYRGHGEITRCLMEAGADCRLVNSKCFTAENEAVVQGHTDVVNYLRSGQNVQSSVTGERNDSFSDTMIQLDAPTVTSAPDLPSSPPAVEKPQAKHLLQTNKQQKYHSAFHVRNCNSEFSPRSEPIDFKGNHLRDLSWIVLDPPEDFHPAPKSMPHSHNRSDANCGQSSSNLHTHCFICNCVNDFTSGTRNTTRFYNSSNASDDLCNNRREYVDLQEEKLVNKYDNTQKEDILLSSLGVRNPPVIKQFSQIGNSTWGQCFSGFSDMYDSTLFSFRSIKYGSLLPL